MSKQIFPKELAEIVTGLLVNPSLLGELETAEKHRAFMLRIGSVVADYCGGDAWTVHKGGTDINYLSDENSSPYLSVSPNDSLPSLHQNVWAYHDPSGWEDEEEVDIDKEEPLDESKIAVMRSKLQTLLCQNDNESLPENTTLGKPTSQLQTTTANPPPTDQPGSETPDIYSTNSTPKPFIP